MHLNTLTLSAHLIRSLFRIDTSMGKSANGWSHIPPLLLINFDFPPDQQVISTVE